jgi:hypothetical protein
VPGVAQNGGQTVGLIRLVIADRHRSWRATAARTSKHRRRRPRRPSGSRCAQAGVLSGLPFRLPSRSASVSPVHPPQWRCRRIPTGVALVTTVIAEHDEMLTALGTMGHNSSPKQAYASPLAAKVLLCRFYLHINTAVHDSGTRRCWRSRVRQSGPCRRRAHIESPPEAAHGDIPVIDHLGPGRVTVQTEREHYTRTARAC